jgi:Uncharacterized alpha/beta hydrolase domain (DUF2235)
VSDEKKPHSHGKHPDGVNTDPADAHDMATYGISQQAMAKMPVPIFQHAGNPHERIFVAAFDGTWNDADKDPEHKTNVGLVRDQIEKLNDESPNSPVKVGYVKGVGTQDNFVERTLDGAFGYTYDKRLEEMYEKFTDQAKAWLKEDPQAQIRIAEIGFSRGAEQAAGFARLLHERGIQDPDGRREVRGEDGRMHVEYTKPPLVAPGLTPQAVGLFDPVGTGEPRNHDRRLPPSVVSGFQIVAEDELRGAFKSTSIIDQGMTADGRLLGVTAAGAHTDVGGGYHLNGLGIRSGNLMVDYLNALSDTPYLKKTAEPSNPAMNVVHRSEEGMHGLMRINAAEQGDARRTVETMAPRSVKGDRENAEPVDALLKSSLEHRNMPITAAPAEKMTPVETKLDPSHPSHGDHKLLMQSTEAVRKLDAELGRKPDADSERMSASVALLAKKEGIPQVDKVVLSTANNVVKAGENVIVVHGDPQDPSHARAHMKTKEAVETPVSESLKQMEALNGQQNKGQTPPPILQATQDSPNMQPEVQRQSLSR